MMKSISRNKKYVMAGAAIAALTAPQMVLAADAPVQNEQVLSVEMVNPDGVSQLVNVDLVVNHLQDEGFKLTQTGFENLVAAGVDYLDTITVSDVVNVVNADDTVVEDGFTDEEKAVIDAEIAKVNETRQDLIKQAIQDGKWQPYYAFEYQRTPGFFEVTVVTDEEGNKTNFYEYNKVYYGSLLESHLRNYNASVTSMAYEHGWESAHAPEGSTEPGWKDVLDEGHNAYMATRIQDFNNAPGIVPYVVHLNHTQDLANEYGVPMVAEGYFDSKFNSPDLFKGLIPSGDAPVVETDAEKAAKELAAKEKAAKELADKEKADKEKADKEKADKELADKALADKEKADKELADKEKADKELVKTKFEIKTLDEFKDLAFSLADPASKTLDLKMYFASEEGSYLDFHVSYGEEGTYDAENFSSTKDTLTITPKIATQGDGALITVTATLVDKDGKAIDENGAVIEFDKNGDPIGKFVMETKQFHVTIDGIAEVEESTDGKVIPGERVATKEEMLKDYKNFLPQTGTESNSLFAGLGVMLIGLATALGLRRKNKVNK